MIADPQGTVVAFFLVFCRIGGCMMVLPGFSSARLPMQIRLFISLALSMALLPILWSTVYPKVHGEPSALALVIMTEIVIGVGYGLIAHLYILGLQFAGTAISMLIAFQGPPGGDILEDTSEAHLSSFMSLAGMLILFMFDFHHIVLKALVDSYNTLPMGQIIEPNRLLITFTDTLSATFNIALRLSSPFLLYGLLFNLAVGFVNKLAPHIPVYFISTPFIVTGGIFLIYLGIAAMLHQFAIGFPGVFGGF